MKVKIMPYSKTVKTNRTYTFDEVFETLAKDGKLPAEPYIYKLLGLKAIHVPGTETADVSVLPKKGKIVVNEVAKPSVTNLAIDFMTEGWSTIAGRNVTGIGDVVNTVAEEVQRLFGS